MAKHPAELARIYVGANGGLATVAAAYSLRTNELYDFISGRAEATRNVAVAFASLINRSVPSIMAAHADDHYTARRGKPI